MDKDDIALERPLADALRALKQAAAVPPAEPEREAALLSAFDAAHLRVPPARRDYWYLGAFAAAAMLCIAVGLPATHGRPGGSTRGTQDAAVVLGSRAAVPPPSPGDFTIVPGAAGLPPMESGTLVRMDVPVSMLPSLGVTPPPGQVNAVTADLVVAQDGLPRAVRLVSP
jgi:hypothetical protein